MVKKLEDLPEFRIELVKVLGVVKGDEGQTELIMDRDQFFDWIKKLNKGQKT